MSPLGPGPAGYKDWQRVVSWDNEAALLESFLAEHEGERTSETVQTSRFAYLVGRLFVLEAPVKLRLAWWSASTGFGLIADRVMVLDPSVEESARLHIPNLGPWLSLTTTPAGIGTKYQLGGRLSLSNRVYPLELIPRSQLLLSGSHTFAAAGEVNVRALEYYAGPMRVEGVNFEAAGSTEYVLEMSITPGEWFEIDRLTITAAEVVATKTMIAPATAWRIKLRTFGKAVTSVTVTPSMTGST